MLTDATHAQGAITPALRDVALANAESEVSTRARVLALRVELQLGLAELDRA